MQQNEAEVKSVKKRKLRAHSKTHPLAASTFQRIFLKNNTLEFSVGWWVLKQKKKQERNNYGGYFVANQDDWDLILTNRYWDMFAGPYDSESSCQNARDILNNRKASR